jgi:dual oxidase
MTSWIISSVCCALLVGVTFAESGHYEYPPYDGWFNNIHNPSWGAAETQLFRRVPPAYRDGVYEPSGHRRPNPINVSDAVFGGATGNGSTKHRTAFLVFFGQQVVEEILDAQRGGCPVEYFNIPIPKGHKQYDPDGTGNKELPIVRTRYDFNTGLHPSVPRQQLNEISAFIDGTLIYGPNKAWTDALRLFENGLLASTNDTGSHPGREFPALNDLRLPFANPAPPRDHKLKPVKRFYKIGNPRGNENPFLLTFGILWFRYHNYQARRVQAEHPDWRDERVFNEARKWVIAVQQNIIMYEWLPAWLGVEPEKYKGYDPTINPQVAVIFQSAAMRFGHTLVPPGVYRRNETCHFYRTTKATVFDGQPALRTCNAYWNPQEGVEEHDIDAFLMGMASQIAEKEDMTITPDLKGDVFGPLEFSRRDLMAVNIQRGRDHGLPDYNTARRAYGLEPRTSWEQINSSVTLEKPEILDAFREQYGDTPDDVDIWPAGMLETDGGPGELFTAVIKDQFQRIRDGDRFWFENKNNGLFTDEEIEEIRKINVTQLVYATTNIKEGDIQPDPFRFVEGDVCWNERPKQLAAEDMENCTQLETFDYFSGSEGSYAGSLVALLSTFFVVLGSLVIVAKKHQKAVEEMRAKSRPQKKNREKSEADGSLIFEATEFLGMKEGDRPVVVKLDKSKKAIVIMTPDKKLLRVIDLNLLKNTGTTSLDLVQSAEDRSTLLVIRVLIEYDLILRFDSMMSRNDFMNALQNFCPEVGVRFNAPQPMEEKHIQNTMRTKSVRQAQLERFFKTVFNQAFHYDTSTPSEDYSGSKFMELTKAEFAEVLALKSSSMFVESMFAFADKDNNGYLSYNEFLQIIIIFSKGTADDKAKLMFDMYDTKGAGTLTVDEFKMMLMSLVELANEEIEDDKITNMIETILRDIGHHSNTISFSDFQKILKDYKSELSYLSLNLQVEGKNQKINKQPVRQAAPTRARQTIYKAYGSDYDEEMLEREKRFSTIDPEIRTISEMLPKSPVKQQLIKIHRVIQNYRLQIFWASLYLFVCIGIFAERAYYYSVEREHGGLRQISGYGVTVTRGAASGMMFTFSCLLVTMCRNLITKCRETFLHRYIPFDSAINGHKFIAFIALVFTLMHIVGHCINFYHISTQPADDLTCYFRNFFHA